MKKRGLVSLIFLGAAGAYLGFAPVSIAPASWQAPLDDGYVGVFSPNDALANLKRISLDQSIGPEDVTELNGFLYATSQTGDITRIHPSSETVKIIANTGGVPLGIEAHENGIIYIADAHKGLLSLTVDGTITTLTESVNDTPILYADDLDIAADGVIYFSDASTKFGAKANGTTLAASLLEIMESKGTGRVLAYDPRTQTTRIVIDGLVFPNGVAMHPDGDILVNETGRYRVLKIDPVTGRQTEWISNLPGFPDNINRAPNGTYLLGLISPRSKWLDENSDKPNMRKLAMRLPAFMRPKAIAYGHIVQLDRDGNVLRSFQDPKGAYHDATGAIVYNNDLYVTSLHETDLAFMPYQEIQ